MKGNAEFLVLFIPFLTVAIIAIYGAFFFPLANILVNPLLVIIAQVVLTLIGIFCIIVDVFALMVQYVNWKYYNEE